MKKKETRNKGVWRNIRKKSVLKTITCLAQDMTTIIEVRP